MAFCTPLVAAALCRISMLVDFYRGKEGREEF
jgi:hypothetical protein